MPKPIKSKNECISIGVSNYSGAMWFADELP